MVTLSSNDVLLPISEKSLIRPDYIFFKVKELQNNDFHTTTK